MREVYFRKTNNGKEKYEIIIDEDKLEELKIRIAKNCGELSMVHKECKYGYIPQDKYMTMDPDKEIHYYEDVRYYESGNKEKEYDQYETYEVSLFYCDYKDYTCPSLINFINRLLYFDKEAIKILLSGNIYKLFNNLLVKDKIILIQKEINELNREYGIKKKEQEEIIVNQYNLINNKSNNIIDNINDLESLLTSSKNKLLKIDNIYQNKLNELNNKLDYLESIKDINSKQEDITSYITEMFNYIKIHLIDKISNEEINRYKEFFKTKEKVLKYY